MTHATSAPTYSTTLTTFGDLSPLHQAVFGYLARYDGNTRDLYERHLNYWITWCAQHGLDPMTVKRTHVELYVRHRTEVGNKASSVHTSMTPVKGMYQMAFLDGVLPTDPAAHIRLPKVQRPRQRVALDRGEMIRMLMASRDISPRHWALITLLGVMGMRVSEAIAVTASSFTEVRSGYQMLNWTAKGSKPRSLPLPASALRALEAAAAASPSDLVVPKLDGGLMNRHSAAGMVNAVVRRAGLGRPVNPHLLRGSAITHLLDAGVEIRDVANFSGHEDVRTLRRHYDLTQDNPDRSAVHILAARLAS